jgi:hypothetical protein
MTLKSSGGLLFQGTTLLGLILSSTNVGLLSKLEKPDDTTIRLKIITIINMVTILTILIMAYGGEKIIDKNFDTGIKLEVVGFVLTILNLIISIIIIVFLILIKNKSEKNMIPIYVSSVILILCNVITFMTYAFAVNEDEWFS